jgi:inorganic triphosphatase YgiF
VERDLETELKFEITAAGAKALSERFDLASLGRSRALRSIYYDTPETELRDHGFVLRVRDDGEHRVQAVKQTPTGANGVRRGEWEHRLEGRPDLSPDLDVAIRTPLGEILNRRELAFVRPVFEVELQRITRGLEIDGAVIELALDRGWARAEERRAPISEIELELKSGSPKALFALASDCASMAAIELCFVSKAARGFALLDEAEPAATSASNPGLGPGATAGEAFHAIAGAALGQVVDNARTLRGARLVEVLHQLRVGVRRLRSAMSLFRPVLADGAFEAIKTELKWLSGELDQGRDLDVFTEDVFRPALRRDPELAGLAAFGERLAAAREQAYDRAEAAIGSARFRALALRVLAWIEAGDWTLGDDPMLAGLRQRPAAALAAEEFERRRHKIVKAGGRLETMAPAERHKLRIRVKRLRYACGFFESLYSGQAAKDQKAFSTAARDLQDSLGALNDIAFSRDLAQRVAALDQGGDAGAAFAAGVLAGQALAPTEKRMKAAVKAHKLLKDAESFW